MQMIAAYPWRRAISRAHTPDHPDFSAHPDNVENISLRVGNLRGALRKLRL
jgi:hypothetical protein